MREAREWFLVLLGIVGIFSICYYPSTAYILVLLGIYNTIRVERKDKVLRKVSSFSFGFLLMGLIVIEWLLAIWVAHTVISIIRVMVGGLKDE